MNKKDLKDKRVRIAPCVVSQSTKKCLNTWRDLYGVPHGRIVDSLLERAIKDEMFMLSTVGNRKSLVKGNVQQTNTNKT
jgi:hypothetical protein